MPEVMFGFNKNLMVIYMPVANMHTNAFAFEAAGMYAKYRLLSGMKSTHSACCFCGCRFHPVAISLDEITLMGDKNGMAGHIATHCGTGLHCRRRLVTHRYWINPAE